ncbi:MAG: nuclear transport factor 2 family protein [Gammaproteobacteria bacterium]|nr:nuclear transport factor 2 family protein [Gammaproteobacteria bacterium]MCP5200245.1 nuclear transport factor 2 family protein [Gammaproteobacteria bacterium]
MSARDEILALLNRYSFTVDGGDLDGFAALFEQGEWSVEGNRPSRGAREIHDNVLSKIIIYPDGTPRTRHVNTNIELDIDEGAGTARGQRYVTVLQGTDGFPLQTIFAGHYHDAFVREDGRWRFASTVVHRPLMGDMSKHLRNTDFVET